MILIFLQNRKWSIGEIYSNTSSTFNQSFSFSLLFSFEIKTELIFSEFISIMSIMFI